MPLDAVPGSSSGASCAPATPPSTKVSVRQAAVNRSTRGKVLFHKLDPLKNLFLTTTLLPPRPYPKSMPLSHRTLFSDGQGLRRLDA